MNELVRFEGKLILAFFSSAIQFDIPSKSGLTTSLHFLMAIVKLLDRGATWKVRGLALMNKYTTFSNNPTLMSLPYFVTSTLLIDAFEAFVSYLNGSDIEITHDHFTGLNRLCLEFGYRELAAKLQEFRSSQGSNDEQLTKNVNVQETIDRLESHVNDHEYRLMACELYMKAQQKQDEAVKQPFNDVLERWKLMADRFKSREDELKRTFKKVEPV
jgi:hypothetical protein